jgi:hypothetical protein
LLLEHVRGEGGIGNSPPHLYPVRTT